jgi:hypothetical protein
VILRSKTLCHPEERLSFNRPAIGRRDEGSQPQRLAKILGLFFSSGAAPFTRFVKGARGDRRVPHPRCVRVGLGVLSDLDRRSLVLAGDQASQLIPMVFVKELMHPFHSGILAPQLRTFSRTPPNEQQQARH